MGQKAASPVIPYIWAYLLAGVSFGVYNLLDLTCPLLYFFHIPCPGCGMSRAMMALLRLDFRAAFTFHPMVWSLPLLPPALFLEGKITPYPLINRLLIGLIIFGFIASYFVRLYQIFAL